MEVLIQRIGLDLIADYAKIPSICEVRSQLFVEENVEDVGGFGLRECPVSVPFTKNYDLYDAGGPIMWSERFDISRWGIWIARKDGEVAGGAAVAWNTPSLDLLENRRDSAVLYDIRVRAGSRRQVIGTALFREAVRWAKSKNCRLLKIETQNVNVVACRFYAKMGCHLGRIDHLAYTQCSDFANEVMLVWHLDLTD